MTDCLQLKLVLIGSVNVGKTCLKIVLQGHKGPLPLTRPTPFSETSSIHYEDDDSDPSFPRIVCHLFDTAGQERFNAVVRSTYRGAKIVFIVFAVDDRGSFDAVDMWFSKVKNDVDPEAVFILVGNKSDLPNDEREVTTAEADAHAKDLGLPYFETSAADSSNVKETFQYAVREAVKRVRLTSPKQNLSQPKIVRPCHTAVADSKKKDTGCC